MFEGIPGIASTLSQGRIRDFRSVLISIPAVIIAYYFTWQDYIILLNFAILVFVFCKYKFDGRVLIGFAISLLLITGSLTYLKAEDSIQQVAVMSYSFLVAGIICLLIEFFRKKKNNIQTGLMKA